MCTYSMIADHYINKWPQQYPSIYITPEQITRSEFEALRKEMSDLKELLVKAKEYDAQTGQPDCEMADKVAILKKVAELVGIDITNSLPEEH